MFRSTVPKRLKVILIGSIVSLTVIFSLAAPTLFGLNALGQASFAEGFDDTGPTLPGQDGPANLIAAGWIFRNQSQPKGPTSWYGSGATQAFGPHSGTGFLANDWNSTVCNNGSAISNWAILPAIPGQVAGDGLSFYIQASVYYTRDDRLQVRYSPTGGTSTGTSASDVGDFTGLLLDANPVPKGLGWVVQNITLPGAGRIAFRYYLPQAGFCQLYGGFFGIDTLVVGDPPGGPYPIPGPGETVTWTTALSPIVIEGRVIIPAGGTVIVEAGVEIQVTQDSTLVVEGTLQGAGTAASPILITAPAVYPPAVEVSGVLDLAYATVTGQIRPLDGANLLFSNSSFQSNGTIFNTTLLSAPTFIQVDSSQFSGDADLYVSDATLVLRDSTFNGAFFGLTRGYLYVNNVTVDGNSFSVGKDYQPVYLNNLTVTNSPGAGLNLGGSQEGNDFFLGANVVLQNNLYPVRLDSGGLLPGSSLPASGNTNNLVQLSDFFGQRGPVTLADAGLPYYVSGTPAFTGVYRLLPGVDVLLDGSSIFNFEDGTLIARGLPGAPVTFQRFNPAQAWQYIMTPYRLEHVTVGGSSLGLVYAALSPARYVDSATFSNNGRAVIGPVVIRKSQFINNTTGAVTSGLGDLNGATNPNSFTGNTLAVSTANDATHNWWGDPSGPTTPQTPGGTGDPIAQGVPFIPFRTSAPNFADTPPVVNLRQPYFLLEPGNKVALAWEASDNVGIASYRILFSAAGINPDDYTLVADNLPASQTAFEWTVPNIGFQVTGEPASIRVVAVDTAGQEAWDSAEVLVPSNDMSGTLTLTTVLTGPYKPGDHVDICWTASGLDFSASGIDAALFLDGGDRYISLGGVTTYLNCLPLGLNMPFVSTDSARVGLRLTGSLNRVKWFFSEPFTIRPDSRVPDAAPSVSILSPAEGAVFAPGALIPITWSAADDEGLRSFDLQASYDSGRTWHVIAKDLPGNATSFSWQTAPGSGFANVRLRLVAIDQRFQDTSATRNISTSGGGQSTTIHVGDLDGTSAPSLNGFWKATVTVTAHDGSENLASGVTVRVSWSRGYRGKAQCTTDATGTCTLTSGDIANARGSVTFTVARLIKAGFTYVSTSNHDPDGSSNGTVIVVSKPQLFTLQTEAAPH